MKPGMLFIIYLSNKRLAVYLGLSIFVFFSILSVKVQDEVLSVNFGYTMAILSPMCLAVNTFQKEVIYHIETRIRMKKIQLLLYVNSISVIFAYVLAFLTMIIMLAKSSIAANRFLPIDYIKYFIFIFLYLLLINSVHNLLYDLLKSKIASFFIAILPITLEYISSSFPDEYRFVFAFQAVYEIFAHSNFKLYVFILVLSQAALFLSMSIHEGVLE